MKCNQELEAEIGFYVYTTGKSIYLSIHNII